MEKSSRISAKIDIDRAARAALQAPQKEPTWEETCAMLSKLITIGSWNIGVVPIRPRRVTEGGIEVVDQTIEAEETQNRIGRVFQVGPTALEGKTASGIPLNIFTDGIRTREDLVGKYLLFDMYAGKRLHLRNGHQIVSLVITDLIAHVHDPHAWRFYY